MNQAHRKAKPTDADLRAASRLKRLWDKAAAESRQLPRDQWLTQRVVEEALGVNQSAVSQYLNGLIPLNYRAVLAFSRILGISPEAIRDDLPEQAAAKVREPSNDDYGDWESVLAFPQSVALGDGSEPEDYAVAHKLKFRAESLRRKGLSPSSLAVYYGRGDSMEPRIRDGDAVLFDTKDVKPKDGCIYVIRDGKDLFAKRCEVLDDIVYFRSDNPNGDHNWRKPRRMDNPRRPVEIIGRVRWIGSWE